MKFLSLAITALLLGAVSQSASSADSPPYVLINGHLFAGDTGRIRNDVMIFVKDGRIERIGRNGDSVPSDYEIIDLDGNYLLPGLIDAHTHISSLDQARRALESGVTTVRSGSVSAYQDVALRSLVRKGAIPGPDMIAAGVFVTPELGDTLLADPRLHALADGVVSDEALRMLVDINADRGVDVIKTRGTQRAGLPDTDPRQQVYTEQQLRVIVEQAATHGIPVMVHAHGDEGARAAVLAGARSIEHGTYLSDETLRLMKERGTWLVPTWVTMNGMKSSQGSYVLRLRGQHMVPHLERAIRSAYRMGIPMATGVDSSYDERSTNRVSQEVEQFVRLGMTPFDALQAATAKAAELLGVDERTGRIAEGMEADLILVAANPLENIETLQDVLLVMSNGQIALKRIPFGVAD